MTTTVNHSTAIGRFGVLVFIGVAATVVGLGTAGHAAADSPPPGIPLPFIPGTPPPPLPALPPAWDASVAPPQTTEYVPGSLLPAPPDAPWAPPQQPSYIPAPWTPAFGDSVSLNPQPLPPGPERGRRVGLNPQPLPPGPDKWRDVLPLLPGF